MTTVPLGDQLLNEMLIVKELLFAKTEEIMEMVHTRNVRIGQLIPHLIEIV